MQFVIPKFSARNVADWKELFVKIDEKKIQLNEATAMLINYMAIIDVSDIKRENIEDVWRRIAIHQAIFGSLLSDTSNKQSLFLTRPDIERHIGIQIEARQRSFEEFCLSIQKDKEIFDYKRLPSYIANGNKTLLNFCEILNHKENLKNDKQTNN